MRHLLRLLTALLLVASTPAARAAPALEVHFIDVGQGDAILVRSPGGKTVLVDAGNTEAAPAVNDYLARLGVTTLDLVVGTHPHLDHIGGMLEVLKAHRPGAYLDPAWAHPLEEYEALLAWLEAEKVPVRTARAGRTITIEPGLVLELLAPSEPLFTGTRSDANSNSVVLRLVHGRVSFLLVGDAEETTEDRLVERDAAESAPKLPSTVLKVAHHGGRHSTTERFLRQVAPQFAVISCGHFNGYGHPAPPTLARLEAQGARVLSTHSEGDIIASSDGAKVTWRTTGAASARLDEPGGRRSFARGERGDGPGRPQGGDQPAAAGPVDINAASASELASLPGIGASLAARIVEHRRKAGPFRSPDDLARVAGVGEGLVEKLRPRLAAGAQAAAAETTGRDVVARTDPPRAPPPVAPDPPPVAPVARADTGEPAGTPAPRPEVKKGVAYRVVNRGGTAPPPPPDGGFGGRLLVTPAGTRVNLNLAPAQAIADASGLSLEQAALVVRDRTSRGPYRAPADLARVAGLAEAARAALARCCSTRMDLNDAGERDLVAIGLTPAEARAVVAHRTRNGGFESIDDLEDVDALAPARRALFLPMLTVARRSWN